MFVGVAIAIGLSRVAGSAGVARFEEGIADALASGVGFVVVCCSEVVIVHVSLIAVASANVPWSASQGDCALRQSARDWDARGPASNAPPDVLCPLV